MSLTAVLVLESKSLRLLHRHDISEARVREMISCILDELEDDRYNCHLKLYVTTPHE